MTDDPEGLARKVMSNAVSELIAAGCHPSQIVPALETELESMRQMIREIGTLHR